MTTAPLLDVRHLGRHFAGTERPAVADLSFELAEGEILALVGPSGCGKSTTLRMIAGFETPDHGRVALAGRDITGTPPERRGIGMVFQDYALFPHMTIAENVGFGARDSATVTHYLEMVGLAGLRQRFPDQLSGGQQQRVALARSFAAEPRLILLDEPFSNLDAALRASTRREIRRLLKAAGIGIVFVTHDQEEALSFADRLAVMDEGRILQLGTAQAVYDQPSNAFVAGFLGRTNLIDGVARGAVCDTALGPLPLLAPAHGPVRLSLRPENLAITAAAAGEGNGRLLASEFKGHDTTYWVACGQTEVQIDVMRGPRLAGGTEVTVTVSGTAVALSPT